MLNISDGIGSGGCRFSLDTSGTRLTTSAGTLLATPGNASDALEPLTVSRCAVVLESVTSSRNVMVRLAVVDDARAATGQFSFKSLSQLFASHGRDLVTVPRATPLTTAVGTRGDAEDELVSALQTLFPACRAGSWELSVTAQVLL